MMLNYIFLDNDSRDYLSYRFASGDTIEIFDITIGSERGVGKGKKLIGLLLDKVKGKTHLIFAITRFSNRIAQEFYFHVGFSISSYLPGFYRDEDAVMFIRRLDV